MLETFIKQLGQEFEITDQITQKDKSHYNIPFENDLEVDAFVTENLNYAFKSSIASVPQANLESLFVKLMDANTFGKSTFGAVIGLNEDSNQITLSCELDSNSTYTQWKEKLEDFVNASDIWKNEILNNR